MPRRKYDDLHKGLIPFAAAIVATVAGLAARSSSAGEIRLSPLLQTGQASCYSEQGQVIDCAGTGQDGEFRTGIPADLVDNGDGTITDRVTGLMWEKMSDDRSIHDRDSSVLVTTKLGTLNATAFAGHTDWRAPNARELESIQGFGPVPRSFRQHCVYGCSVLNCSCPSTSYMWTSTIVERSPSFAWTINFRNGFWGEGYRDGRFGLRAVRTDSRVVPRSRVLRTSQQTCWDTELVLHAEPSPIACDGTGQDGDIRSGASRSFQDNGDGTITDNVTGLTWEKLARDGSIHDVRTRYSWSDAYAVKVAALNGSDFAGHSDWRLPNIKEIASIRSFARFGPAVYDIFNRRCADGCSAAECSCDNGFDFWSSTTFQKHPYRAWVASMWGDGKLGVQDKPQRLQVRAVRTAVQP